MFSISELARVAGLSRRTAQFWVDERAIDLEGRKPIQIAETEVVLARILKAMTQNRPPIGWIREMAEVLRLCLRGDASVPSDVARAFAAARRGERAFLVIAPEVMSDDASNWPHSWGAIGEAELSRVMARALRNHCSLGITAVDLRYAFDLAGGSGVAFPEDAQ